MEKNEFTAGGDSTYWAIHTDNKTFSKARMTSEYATQMFWFKFLQTSKFLIVIRSWRNYSAIQENWQVFTIIQDKCIDVNRRHRCIESLH